MKTILRFNLRGMHNGKLQCFFVWVNSNGTFETSKTFQHTDIAYHSNYSSFYFFISRWCSKYSLDYDEYKKSSKIHLIKLYALR